MNRIVDSADSTNSGSLNKENDHYVNHALLPSLKVQLRVLALSVQALERRVVLRADMSGDWMCCQHTLRSEQAARMAQRGIRKFFN